MRITLYNCAVFGGKDKFGKKSVLLEEDFDIDYKKNVPKLY